MAIIKCIDSRELEEFLTLGNEYEVIMDKITHWKIKGDNGVIMVVDKDRFE